MADSDRMHLPIRRPSFAGTTHRTLEGSQPDWDLIGHPTPPSGAPNVLLVLIDDAGFGNPSTFGGPIQTPNYTRMAEQGIKYNRFHVTALCSPTRAALLTGRNNHFVGFGSVGEFAGGFPGYSASLPRDCAPLPRILRDNGYSTSAYRQVAPDPRRPAGSCGAVRPLAERLGVRLLLRVPGRRLGPVGSLPDREPEGDRDTGGVLRRGEPVLLPGRDGRPRDRVAARRPGPGRREAVLHLLLHRVQSRAAPRRRGVGEHVQGEVRSGVGQAPRRDLRASEGVGRRPGRCGAHTARRRVPSVGRRARQAQGVLLPADGGVRRILRKRRPQRRSPDRSDQGAGGTRQHGRRLDLGRQRRQHGGHGHRFLQRDDDAERHPADGRDAAAAIRAIRGHGEVGSADHGSPLRRGVGVGRERPVQVGQAGRFSPRRHAQPDGDPMADARH